MTGDFPDWAGFTPEFAAAELLRLLDVAEKAVAAIEAARPVTYEGFVWTLDDATRGLWHTWGRVGHMIGVMNSEAWRKVQDDFQVKMVQFSLRVGQSKALYEIGKSLLNGNALTGDCGARGARALPTGGDNRGASVLSTRRRIVEKMIRSAEEAGVGLEGGQKARFNEIAARLAQLGNDFYNAVIDATAAFKYEKDGKTYTIDDANYPETMKHCADREVRERLYRARVVRAPENEARIDEILKLRDEQAKILGFANFAEQSLAVKCAPSVAAVYDMIAKLDEATDGKAAEDEAELAASRQQTTADDGGRLEPWDRAYEAERLREAGQLAEAEYNQRMDALEEEYEETRSAGKLEEHYFSYEVYDNTINTLENRFVKYSLKQIEKKLGFVFEKILNRNATEISQAHREQWESYARLIHKYLKHPFFKSVGKFEGLRQESLVLQSRMGYQQVYKDWLKLKRGIDFYQGATNVGTLQIWEIYELWCFLKVKKMVLNILRISEDSPLVSEPNGPIITFQQDSKAAREKDYRICIAYPAVGDTMEPEKNAGDKGFADYLKKHEGDSISIHYQHTYSRIRKDDMGMMSMTTEQRPDIVLNIIKADGNVLTYLYDAKYRVWSDRNLDVTDDWIEQDEDMAADFKGADYPPADAINQMHRYRDSIYYCGDDDKLRKEIVGGYILFPGRGDDESIARRFYSQSISRINIGAFPLLPSGEEVSPANDPEGPQLFNHLKDIILARTTYFGHVKDAVPQRGREYTDEE